MKPTATCRACSGRGQVLKKKTLGEIVAQTLWQTCQACAGKGKAAPTLLPWTAGPKDRCDHCGKAGPLWSAELAGDEVALCRACWQALAAAIGAAVVEKG